MIAVKEDQLAALQAKQGDANAPEDLPVTITTLQNEIVMLQLEQAELVEVKRTKEEDTFCHNEWRTYQERLQREDRIRLFKRKLVLVGGVIGGLLAVIFSGAWMSSRMNRSVPVTPTLQKQNTQKQKPVSDSLSRKTLAALLVPSSGDSIELTDEIAIENKGVHYTLKTTVNPKVQTYVDNMLERSKTLQAAVVVLNPHDGRVLVMSGHGKNGDDTGLCLKAEYPAASLFKIVSAAAALEAAGYTPEKTLYFNGSRHTLYKNQLKQQQNNKEYLGITQL